MMPTITWRWRVRPMSRNIPPKEKSVSSLCRCARLLHRFARLAMWPSEKPDTQGSTMTPLASSRLRVPTTMAVRLVNSPPNAAPSTIPIPSSGIQPFGLARVEEVAGHQPTLRDQHDAEQADEDVQHVDHPREVDQRPHRDQAGDRQRHGCEHRGAERALGRKLAVEIREHPAEQGDQDIELRQFVDVELRQEHRPGNGFQDVIGEEDR